MPQNLATRSEPPTAGSSREWAAGDRRFCFARDTLAFVNELVWTYHEDPVDGTWRGVRRNPPPAFALRCFGVARAARQFWNYADFRPDEDRLPGGELRRRVRSILRRSAVQPVSPVVRVVIPGYGDLREFSAAHEELVKEEIGGAWRSYLLRSHWRMVFPISRAHQAATAARLVAALRAGRSPIVHLVRFPQLTINHAMWITGVNDNPGSLAFDAYDPNVNERPARLEFDRTTRSFRLARNFYWPGGPLDAIEIYRSVWF